MGSTTCYHLARRGYKVLGLEQFNITHEYGSHAGQSRIIRKAYFENPDYVPLLKRAYENWKSFEEETGTQLFFKTGLLYFCLPDDVLIKGVKQSASLYNIEVNEISQAKTNKQFPQFKIPENFQTLFEPDAGFVTPEKTIRLYEQQAIKNGCTIHTNEKVIKWEKEGSGISVTTNKNIYYCKKLIITAGAWAGKIIPGLSQKIKITRQFIAWIKPKNWDAYTFSKFPCWLMTDDKKSGCYYGFPILSKPTFEGPDGLKIAHHYPAEETDPEKVNRQMAKDDEENLRSIFNKYFNDDFGSILSYKICLYANSPDEDFIIDKLPGYGNQVIVACGFSGHGFKFVPVIGEILADLATQGKTNLPIEFLSLKRFSASPLL
jgi:sarcosine oxidase